MRIRLDKLYTPTWKLTEVLDDLAGGRPSRSSGPITVSKLGRGRYFILNGNHRAVEAIRAGDLFIDAELDRYLPDITHGNAHANQVAAAVPIARRI